MIISLGLGPGLLPGHGHIAAADHTLPGGLGVTGHNVAMIRGRHVNGHRLCAWLGHLLDGVESGVAHQHHALHTLTQGVQASLLTQGSRAGLMTLIIMSILMTSIFSQRDELICLSLEITKQKSTFFKIIKI